MGNHLDLSRRSTAEVAEALEALRPFAAEGHTLFPLRVGAKTPAFTGWRVADYSGFDFEHWLTIGGNVGIRLTATDLVVDCDPRNYQPGDDPLGRLNEDIGADLGFAPTTLTGAGGRHLYWAKPADVRIAGRLGAYEGIDFKIVGGYVVAPGSIHPDTGQVYRNDPDAPPIMLTSEAPAALLELIRKPDRPPRRPADASRIEPEQMAVLLAVLDPADYGRGKYSEWIRLAAACHDATGGSDEGLEVFAAWCAQDTDYGPEAEGQVEKAWASFQGGKPGGATFRTLLAAVSAAGRRDLVAGLGGEEALDFDVVAEPVEGLDFAAAARFDSLDFEGDDQ